ncbi:MAG: hypothetical protein K0R62_4631 [Nonomuraea muscovyensis]|jgi:hypothetical protein|nr:hypothetical protein [Nonomuraea muscovyensis]
MRELNTFDWDPRECPDTLPIQDMAPIEGIRLDSVLSSGDMKWVQKWPPRP